MDRITEAATKGVQEVWQRLLFEIEWLNNDDVSLGWLECLAGFVEREKVLKKLAGVRAKSVPSMTPPGRGFIRDVPLLWGVLIDVPEHRPATWEEAVPFLVAELRRTVELRWRCLMAYEEGLAAASQALGVTVGHPQMAQAMEVVRTKVLYLHAALQRFERFELPPPGEREREMVRSFWDLEVLREREEQSSSRAMMFESKREELEAWEREQAASLRNGS
jgi:hypothetical protein